VAPSLAPLLGCYVRVAKTNKHNVMKNVAKQGVGDDTRRIAKTPSPRAFVVVALLLELVSEAWAITSTFLLFPFKSQLL
jgi:hypothetical protein